MARSKKSKQEPVVLSREQKIEKARYDFLQAINTPDPAIITPPPYLPFFKVGDKCQIGHLTNCVVVEVLHNGKAVLVEYDVGKSAKRATYLDDIAALKPASEPPVVERDFMIRWWFEAVPYETDNTQELFRPYRPGRMSTCTIDSMMHMYSHDGFVVNPKYQRGYVWTQSDQEQLLDSIFNRLTFGSVVFVQNHGFLHKEDSGVREYLNLDGQLVTIDKRRNYTIEIIDGQQRITTLIKFITNRIRYRGLLFSDLMFKDRHAFMDTSFSYRLIQEEDVREVELLELFLQVNKGVPQSPEHLAKVQALYDAEVSKQKR